MWYELHGDCCALRCGSCCAQNINISICKPGAPGQPVGTIAKEYSGFIKEMMTDADNFHCVFPVDASPPQKLCLIAMIFLLDFMFFEDNSSSSDD